MKTQKVVEKNKFEEKIGLRFNQGERTVNAFLTNFKTKTYINIEESEQRMALLCYFQDELGDTFKCYMPFDPYFYVGFAHKSQDQVRIYIENSVPKILKIEEVSKVDLEQINHLSGRLKKYLKISFKTTNDLTNARKLLDVKKKKQQKNDLEVFFDSKKNHGYVDSAKDLITDIRQYDVPYHCRVCIDTGLRAGKWFQLTLKDKFITKIKDSQKKSIPDLKFLAYDIETSKDPFKFPDKEKDVVIMISIMYEEEAILIINNGFCGQAVQSFDYEPELKPEYRCHVEVYNTSSEKQTLQTFIDIIQNYKPVVITSFNGDKFDYPFIETRCEKNFIEFSNEFGVTNKGGEYFGNFLCHLDCFYWVERDAYLPQGSRGLKAVTRAKLKYEPVQVNPELMVGLAINQTKKLAYYAVSDAVATYYLYVKHIHGFIFALATIIPMMPDQVLRKGSGTLCENLLMAQAYNRNIIFPNKQIENFEKFYRGHLLDTETYTGGKVECLRSGIYRADFPTQFNLNANAFQDLINNLDEIIEFTVKHEKDEIVDNIANYDEVKSTIVEKLNTFRKSSSINKYEALPLIYHIDVAAMYPNIIITNRLQPVAVVNDQICSGCLFNSPQYNCKRSLQWQWKGQYFPLNEGEYAYLKQKQSFKELTYEQKYEAQKNLKKEVRKYCQQVYRKAHIPVSEVRRDTVCMRENSFYVDTVKAFRDRRYEFKGLVKKHKARASQKLKEGDYEQAKQQEKLMELFQSMQLAHKIILNSFYGYVMRKGSRWYSMETAAMVTYIGSNIINDSKNFVEGRLGKPLQLDTDGIWMLLPAGFPEDIKIKFKDGKSFNMSYPCQILNHLIYEKYANPQYQTLTNPENFDYKITKQMTIAFEIDGPYKAMFIPGGKDKKKTQELDIQQHSTQMLKKRYVVFNFKNEVSEFKGLQMKRRGELNIIKMFQSEIFHQYVKGSTLKECYQHCAEIAAKYYNFIINRGQKMTIEDILERLQESKNLSRDVEQYGQSKGVAISSARRLAQYLGPEVVKGKNLCCYYIISAYPTKRPVTERAIPTQIFDADEETQKKFLYSWTKNDAFLTRVDIRDVLDWDYYKERLSTQIQKMVCIPAVMQNVSNPLPSIELPDWLQKKTFDMRHHRQEKMLSYGFGIGVGQPIGSAKKIPQEQMKPIEPENIFDNKNKPLFSITKKNLHSMKTNFKQWLGEQKRIWKTTKINHEETTSMKFNEFKSILHVVPINNSPGSFTIWYYSGNKIQQLLLNFKRHYFIKDNKGSKKAPHEEGSAIEIIVEQADFLKNIDYYDSILGKTFYETKIPLLTSLILKKGNLWRISKQLPIYRQEDVHEQFGSTYLPNIEDNFMPIVYFCRAEVMDNRQIFAVINPRMKEYHFFYVDNSIGKNNDELLKLARKTIKREEVKINIKSKNTQNGVGKLINELLLGYINSLKQTFMIVMQSDCSNQYLRSLGVQAIEEELPVLRIQSFTIPGTTSLDWRQKSLTKVIEESLSATKHVINLLEWSRFTHVPICNLSQETNLLDYITNVTYGRLLHSGDNLTWWNQFSSDIVTTYESKNHTGKIVQPGLYSSYCIEINVDNLAVNTIANSEELIMEDRDTAMIMQKNNQPGRDPKAVHKVQYLDEMTQAKKAFQYMKKMVKGWLKDLDEAYWQKANDLLSNLHKWLNTHSNPLYSPLLSKMVNELMKKIFGFMMKKLTNLGMKIVYANFSKIIVSTDKHTYNEAKNAIEYILRKCMDDNKKLFGYMTLNALGDYYQVLLYKDPYNYAGILVNQEEGANDLVADNALMEIQDPQVTQQKKMQYKFQITKLMNPIIEHEFKTCVLDFVGTLSDIKKQLVKQYANNKMTLMLNYQQLIRDRIIDYIQSQFGQTVIQSVKNAYEHWENQYELFKNEKISDNETESIRSEEEEEEEDSFIVEDSQEADDDLEGEAKIKKGRKHKKQKEKAIMDFQKWGNDKQLDVLIENLIRILNFGDIYDQEFDFLRKQAFKLINQEASYVHRVINPIYPQFQLPCASCFLVNEKPGTCEHCKQPINADYELQTAVWKMMQEQGRDLYCNRCNNIMEGYLKKCGCGGKWQLREQPLQWVPFVQREDEEWNYINRVFEFMGVS